MSLKSVFPVTLNVLRSSKTFFLNTESLCNTYCHRQCLSTNNFFKNIRLLSTKNSQKSENDSTKLVYYGVLTPQIKAVKMFSVSSSIVGIIAQPFLYNEIAATGNIPIIVAAYSFIGFFTFVTPILLHYITKKYVTHLEFNEKSGTYTAKTVNFFCMTKETVFKPEDATVPDVPGMFTTFLAKGRPLFLDPRLFDQPEHYARILGYDKPMDFKLYETSMDESSNSNKKDK